MLAMAFWVLQQSQEYFVVESAKVPDTTVPEGVKRKVIHTSRPTMDLARAEAQRLAAFYNGKVRS